ncbi:hypothetical protein QOZ80_5BG0424890 [Eleusine coracana subsp. coracana]|nr:hypothetical protein QOZ80_5BG0424890 [Eleusine coracana subsp. coracana]
MEGRMSKTAKKKTSPSPASAFTSVAAQLLLRRGSGREAGNGDSLEFFSDLRKCQTGEMIDRLLTPPASPLRSPGTNSSGHSAGAPTQLGRGGGSSASYAKSNSRLSQLGGRTTGREEEKEKATSRLARSSSAASSTHQSSTNTHTAMPRVRTLSSASITAAGGRGSNASVISSATSSPRTPVTARSSAVVAVARQPWSLSAGKSSSRQLTAQTRSTTSSTCQQQVPPPTPSKRANVVAARSRQLAGQSTGPGSTPQASSSSWSTPTHTASQGRRDAHVITWGARALTQSSSNDGVNNTRAVVVVKQTSGSPRNSLGRKIGSDKVAAQRTSTSIGLARSANSNKPTTKPGNGGVPAHSRKPAASQQWSSSRSVMSSTSRLGILTRTTSEASSAGSTISSRGRRPTLGARSVSSAAARVVPPGPDAFPSTRYDAMLLREDPRNLTWLRGCDEADQQGGLELVDASLEPLFLRVDGAVNKDFNLAPI